MGIRRKVYNPYLQQDIQVTAPDLQTLEEYVVAAAEIRDGVSGGADLWRMLQALVDAYNEALVKEADRIQGRMKGHNDDVRRSTYPFPGD